MSLSKVLSTLNSEILIAVRKKAILKNYITKTVAFHLMILLLTHIFSRKKNKTMTTANYLKWGGFKPVTLTLLYCIHCFSALLHLSPLHPQPTHNKFCEINKKKTSTLVGIRILTLLTVLISGCEICSQVLCAKHELGRRKFCLFSKVYSIYRECANRSTFRFSLRKVLLC